MILSTLKDARDLGAGFREPTRLKRRIRILRSGGGSTRMILKSQQTPKFLGRIHY